MRSKSQPSIILAAFITVFALFPGQVKAVNIFWNNGSGNFLWDTSSINWSNTLAAPTNWPNVSGFTGVFAGAGQGTITVSSFITNAIHIEADGYVFAGQPPNITGLAINPGFTGTMQSGAVINIDNTSISGVGNPTGTIDFTGGALAMGTHIVYIGGSSTYNDFTTAVFTDPAVFTQSAGTFFIGYSSPATVTYNSSGTSTANVLEIGRQFGFSELIQQQGAINVAQGSTIAVQVGVSSTGYGTLDLQGGSFNLTSASGGMTINSGGTLTNILTVEGGALVTPTLNLNPASGGTAKVNMTAGSINTDIFTTTGAGTKSIMFSGGTIGADTSSSPTWSPNNVTLGGNVNIRTATVGETPANITFTGVLSGSGGFTETDAGTLTLYGASTYTGSTIINSGTLFLSEPAEITNSAAISIANGAILDATGRSDGTLTLGNTETLNGNGSINGNLVALPGSITAPGTPTTVGTLTVNNNVALGGTLQLSLNRTNIQTSSQLVSVSGTIAYDGTLNVANIGPTLQTGDMFQLFPAAVTTFNTVNLPTADGNGNIYTWNNDISTDGSITVASVTINPNPGRIQVNVSGSALTLSWPTNAGWLLQAQTNSQATGLGTNWVTISGSGSVTTTNLSIDPANGAVFYRLAHP